eukprot:TRINITY_DN2968_c1_g1_i1.p1 TRINITY_DN2968_c1_g1~~TRINITY_DN2968_c1_g1_i1.p1  ORF type:complete len:374 (+),score=55.51 TRINITY_DN2968_c1_g1_i1:152-1273(+)
MAQSREMRLAPPGLQLPPFIVRSASGADLEPPLGLTGFSFTKQGDPKVAVLQPQYNKVIPGAYGLLSRRPSLPASLSHGSLQPPTVPGDSPRGGGGGGGGVPQRRGAPSLLRPWRKSKAECDVERQEGERILMADTTSTCNAGDLLYCFLAHELLPRTSTTPQHLSRLWETHEGEVGAAAATADAPTVLRDAATARLEAAGLLPKLETLLQSPASGRNDSCNRVLPRLWLGGIRAFSRGSAELRRRGITHVVSLMRDDVPEMPSTLRGHLHVRVDDRPEAANLLEDQFRDICLFIHKARNDQNGCVLVHCGAGVSRSATATAAYIMWKLGMPAVAALEIIRRSRPSVRPNLGFLKALKRWEDRMRHLPGFGFG